MGDTTDGIPTNAGTWEYLYDLIAARRVALAKPPLFFPHARRYTFIATGAVSFCKDPTDNPVGILVSTTASAPTIVESGTRMNNECIRNYYVKGGGTLLVDCDY